MSTGSSILPDEAVFVDFRRQCLSTDSWVNKYDSNGMQVWVEVPAKKGKRSPKIHKIKVSSVYRTDFTNNQLLLGYRGM